MYNHHLRTRMQKTSKIVRFEKLAVASQQGAQSWRSFDSQFFEKKSRQTHRPRTLLPWPDPHRLLITQIESDFQGGALAVCVSR